MTGRFRAFLALSALPLTACTMNMDDSSPRPDRDDNEMSARCPVVDSRDWNAFVNAMPGPNARRTLIVTGTVDMPTPGYSVRLIEGRADRSTRPVQHLRLQTTAPDGMVAQVVTPVEVRYDGPAIAQQYSGVVVHCGNRVLARIDEVEAAY